MMFCQLGHAQSLREITGGLAACEGKLRHLGVQDPPKRSTLAYANEHRPWQLYQTVLYSVLVALSVGSKASEAQIPLQTQAAVSGLDRDPAVPVGLRLGTIQTRERGSQAAHGAGS
jgi:hypothetical protein